LQSNPWQAKPARKRAGEVNTVLTSAYFSPAASHRKDPERQLHHDSSTIVWRMYAKAQPQLFMGHQQASTMEEASSSSGQKRESPGECMSLLQI